MKEDIKILEQKLKIIESLCTDDCINKSTVIEPLKYAIENLINRNKELEEENESLVRQYEYQGALMVNEYFSKKQVFELFIPKSLIKEKIEELKDNRKKYFKKKLSRAQYTKSMKMWGAIQVLEELL